MKHILVITKHTYPATISMNYDNIEVRNGIDAHQLQSEIFSERWMYIFIVHYEDGQYFVDVEQSFNGILGKFVMDGFREFIEGISIFCKEKKGDGKHTD